MPKYRRRPLIIDAWQVTQKNVEAISALPGVEVCLSGPYGPKPEGGLLFADVHVPTGEHMRAAIGDWVVHLGDEVYPVSDQLFTKMYEPVEESH